MLVLHIIVHMMSGVLVVLGSTRGRGEKSWYPGQMCMYSVIALLFSHKVVSQLFVTPWTAACQASVLHYLLEFSQIPVIEFIILPNRFNSCGPVLLSSSIFSSIRVFSNEPALTITWHKSVKYQLIENIAASASVLPINIQGYFL